MKKLIILVSIAAFGYGCHVSYSFTGTSVGEAKTISIETFTNRSPLTPPEYTQSFTEELKETFLRQTGLDLVKSNGDLQISGYIKNYYSGPSATTGNETTAQNRLTVTVHVKFVNTLESAQNFSQDFTWFEEYPAHQSLSTVQDQLFSTISKQLTQNIIQKSVGQW